jgi:hypothetical protein
MASFRLWMLFCHVHHTFVTDGSFIACSIDGIADGGVIVWLFLWIEPTLRPSVVVVVTRRSAVDDMSATAPHMKQSTVRLNLW